jgi:tricorn protease-like protein
VALPEGTLWRSHSDGSQKLQLTSTPLLASFPRWSPDGKQIAFLGFSAENKSRLLVVSADGGTLRRTIFSWIPWSGVTPDGSPLLQRDISTQEVYALDFEAP